MCTTIFMRNKCTEVLINSRNYSFYLLLIHGAAILNHGVGGSAVVPTFRVGNPTSGGVQVESSNWELGNSDFLCQMQRTIIQINGRQQFSSRDHMVGHRFIDAEMEKTCAALYLLLLTVCKEGS